VVWRLQVLGLNRTYRFFFAGMLVVLFRSAVLFPFSPNSPVYYHVWAATQPFLWLSYMLVVGELYYLVLREYRGIYSLGRWFFVGAVALSILISGLTVLPTVSVARGASARPLLLYYYAFIERGFVTSLAIFLLLLLGLVAWFPVPLNRNLLIHSIVYSAYFFFDNVIMLYWHAAAGRTVTISIVRLSAALVCLMCWVVFLSRRGEERTASVRLSRDSLAEKRLLGQLENLNATLLRTARK
jgi:hypothetical protein